MFGKMLLPLLGSSPNVWNTCMFFFQGVLLLGYLYAHKSVSFFGINKQSKLHLLILALPLFLLPIVIPSSWSPGVEKNPILSLIYLMVITVGLPFFALSTSAPLLQKWFSHTNHQNANNPYFLYVASNLGSLIALISYPFLIEPNLKVIDQGRLWMILYWVFCGLVFFCAKEFWKSKENHEDLKAEKITVIAWSVKIKWLILSFIPSSMLLGVTTYLTTDIATVPLLWILPLILYLLTFIIVFSEKPIFSHELMIKAMPFLIISILFQLITVETKNILLTILIHLFSFFVCSMVCHGELVKLKPDVKHLTAFYLWMSIGGFFGGLFNSIIAPIVFQSVYEYPLAIVLACFAIPKLNKKESTGVKSLDFIIPVFIFFFIFGLTTYLPKLKLNSAMLENLILFGIPAILALIFSSRPIRFGLSIGAIILGCSFYANKDEKLLYISRSFFGVNKVTLSKDANHHYLIHGRTKHGAQGLNPSTEHEPLTYYFRTGPIGQYLQSQNLLNEKSKVGVIGLGAGSLIEYAKPGQEWRFYEIDPVVLKIAEDKEYFTFLSNAKTNYDVILGDGRLSLNKEPNNKYDLIVIDAFSSDSIPAHLLTKEMMKIYLSKLRFTGVLAFHISNHFLDLEPVLSALSKDANLFGLIQYDLNATAAELKQKKDGSVWVLISRDREYIGEVVNDERWKPLTDKTVRIWTDDFSNIFSVMRWKDN
jgi:hypothetical protein